MSEPLTMSAEREAEIFRYSNLFHTDPAVTDLRVELQAERAAHKRTQTQLRYSREAMLIQCMRAEENWEALERLREVLVALLSALRILASHHEDCYCDDDDGLTGKCLHCIITDAIALAGLDSNAAKESE